MLATFVIGLREGLEAALIVGIIAAFLTKNGRSLLPMWVGVVAGIVISAGVGVTLKVIESSLDQAAQEGMETVIGAVAVVFVTGMILWMTTHARFLKRDLEASARDALGDGTSRALVIMAFLAVLKEGFETSVFLLATFQASTNATLAATGAVLGVVVSAGVGYGLYSGGVRLNLARFFTGTSVFLVLVAAGLVVNAFRTAHEAGWLNAGQQHTLDLSWLAPRGSIQSAVLTGVLGIPADPRLLEVVAWLGYLVPMALILYWPATRRLSSREGARLKLGIGALLVVGAAAVALVVPAPRLTAQGPATLIDASGLVVGTAGLTADASAVTVTLGSNSISVPLSGGTPAQHDGIPATRVAQDVSADTSALPRSLTVAQLVTLGDGRLPVGISAQRNPGPFDVAWTRGGSREVWVAHGQLLDISQLDVVVLTLTGGGLPTSRTIGISSGTTLPDGSVSGAWSSDPAYGQATATSIQSLATREGEASFWRHTLPMGLLIAAVLLLLNGFRVLRRLPSPDRVPAPTSSPPTPTTEGASLDAASTPDRRSTADVR